MNLPAARAVIKATLLRHGVSLTAASVLLAGCGESQLPLSLAPQRLAQEQSHADTAYSILHEFGLSKRDGNNPQAELVDVKGTLYGTTAFGGVYDLGTVFSITKSGKETVLHTFGAPGDGAVPLARLLDVNGVLYGTTADGGENGTGTVFTMTRSGKVKILHNFDYGYSYTRNSGATPVAGLIDVNGTLYGTTLHGGTHPCSGSFYFCGTVFSITTGGTYKVLYNFGARGHDGYYPEAALLNVNGTLYGTTNGGGKYDRGIVFSISTTGQKRTLYSFGTNSFFDGSNPLSDLIDVNGTLYGTTSDSGGGGGTVFSITTNGVENVIYAFDGPHGSDPAAGLINVKGVLYGTTAKGGAKNDGTVFRVTTSGEEQVLHNFRAGGGKNPQAALLEVDGTLYGTAFGATYNHHGNVFSLKP